MSKKPATRQAALPPKFDPSIPSVAVEIGGETFELCFDFRAMAAAKAKLRALDPPVEVNIMRALDFRDLDIDALPAFFYAAALRHQPELEWERVQELLDIRTAGRVYSALASAYVAAIGAPEEGENPPTAPEETAKS